jgi:hypothetical protein
MNSRAKIAIVAGALVAGVGVLFVVGCVGSSKGGDASMTTCQPAQPPVFPTAENLPADQKEYQSPERGYTVRYPADWQVKPNLASYQNIAGDTFFAPVPIGDVRPNVTVTCETIPIGTDSRTFVDAKRAMLDQMLGSSPSTAATLQVDGKDAFAWNYKVTTQGTPQPEVLDKVEALFADDRGGWIIGLLVPDGQIGAYESVFESLVASFHEE